jgi:hypothetical protein
MQQAGVRACPEPPPVAFPLMIGTLLGQRPAVNGASAGAVRGSPAEAFAKGGDSDER